MNIKKQQYLNALGIETWQLRTAHLSHLPIRSANLLETQLVFGTGNPHADLMIISTASELSDDKKEEPFTGLEGQLFNAMLQSIGISRKEVYLTTILKRYSPTNRWPSAEEIDLCTPFLERQIELIHPKLILGLGDIATCYLSTTNASFEERRGKCNRYHSIPLLISYHPSYLLKNPKEKCHAFADLQFASQLLQKS